MALRSEIEPAPKACAGTHRAQLAALLMLWLPGAATAGAGLLGMSLPEHFRPFSDQSPWNQPIPADPPLMLGTRALMANLERQAGSLKADHAAWSIPLFVIDADAAPARTVWFEDWSNPVFDPDDRGYAEGLPIPDGVWPDPQADAHLLLVDTGAMRTWDFSRFEMLGDGRLQASRVDSWDLAGDGMRAPFEGPRWWVQGARGSGLPLIGGLVRPEEVAAGEIRHALVFASPITRGSLQEGGELEVCSPASRTDGSNSGPHSLPMGARLQLDPALELDSLGLSPEAKVMARAMQVYGLYKGDTTHDVFKIYLQNLGADGGAWSGMGLSTLGNIPTRAFRVLDCSPAVRQ